MSNHHIVFDVAPQVFTAREGLAHLVREAFKYLEHRIDPPSSLLAVKVTDFIKKAQDETLIIAQINNRLIGCAFAAIRDDCVYFSKGAVHQPHGRQGVTRSLFEAADEPARHMGKKFLELQTRIELTEDQQAFGALGSSKLLKPPTSEYIRTTSITMQSIIEV